MGARSNRTKIAIKRPFLKTQSQWGLNERESREDFSHAFRIDVLIAESALKIHERKSFFLTLILLQILLESPWGLPVGAESSRLQQVRGVLQSR